MTTMEARYLHARLAAHRAWAGSQPQYVIPGLLDGLDEDDVARAEGCPPAAASSSSSPPPIASPGGLDTDAALAPSTGADGSASARAGGVPPINKPRPHVLDGQARPGPRR